MPARPPHCLATLFRRAFIRRIIALVVVGGLSIFTGESLFADACAEHSTRSSVASVQSSLDVDHDDHTPQSPSDGHQAHVCHCAHAHTSDLPILISRPSRSAPPARVIAGPAPHPLSITLEPQLRPPSA